MSADNILTGPWTGAANPTHVSDSDRAKQPTPTVASLLRMVAELKTDLSRLERCIEDPDWLRIQRMSVLAGMAKRRLTEP